MIKQPKLLVRAISDKSDRVYYIFCHAGNESEALRVSLSVFKMAWPKLNVKDYKFIIR